MSDTLLTTTALNVELDGRTLLEDINLSIGPGEMVGIIGPNGAGKSSLLKALVGLYHCSGGTIRISDRPLSDYSASERALRISYLAQSQELSFAFQVQDAIRLGAHSRESHTALSPGQLQQELNDIAGQLDIGHLLSRRLDQLSGGERQLVHFARILMQKSPIMLLDEPTASLDIGHEAQLMNLLRGQCRQGRAALVAIHNLNSAAAFCDRLLLVDQGRLIADGLPDKVITQARMQALYDRSVLVSRNPMTGSVTVLPLVEHQSAVPLHVHLIGGAGSTVALGRQLLQMGITVTAGIGHEQDSDTLFWEAVGIEHITVPTFSPIESQHIEAAAAMVERADLTIMTEFPVGVMNSGNMLLAEAAAQLWILQDSPDTDSRFYDAPSAQQFVQLQQKAERCITSRQVIELLEQRLRLETPDVEHGTD